MSHRNLYLKTILGAGIAALSVTSASAADPERNGPSFDCKRASSAVEKAICASKALSSLDGQIGTRYAALRKGLDKASSEKLKQDQQWFIATRNAGFSEAEDRVTILRERLSFLNAISWSTPPGIEGVWRNVAGEFIIFRDGTGRLSYTAAAAEPSQGRWVCDAAGNLGNDGASRWIDAAGDPEERLELTRDGASLDVSEAKGKSSPFCGLNGSLAGSYFRTGNAPSQTGGR